MGGGLRGTTAGVGEPPLFRPTPICEQADSEPETGVPSPLSFTHVALLQSHRGGDGGGLPGLGGRGVGRRRGWVASGGMSLPFSPQRQRSCSDFNQGN